jgi:hypothetical protein
LTSWRKRTSLALILSLIAVILILVDGIIWLAGPDYYDSLHISGTRGELYGFWNMFGNFPPSPSLLGGMEILFAIVVLVGAYYIYMPGGYRVVGGSMVAIFSLISLTAGGGFVIGTILGLIGGLLGIVSTREPLVEAMIKPEDQEEHEKF